jgi:hypothetical protein
VDEGSLIINLRAETPPERLWKAVQDALSRHVEELSLRIDHHEAFRPAAPVPVHRDRVAEGASS